MQTKYLYIKYDILFQNIYKIIKKIKQLTICFSNHFQHFTNIYPSEYYKNFPTPKCICSQENSSVGFLSRKTRFFRLPLN